MIKTFTKNELVRFLYEESEEKLTNDIKRARLYDDELDDELDGMNDLCEALDSFTIEAPERVTKNILEYSRSYAKS